MTIFAIFGILELALVALLEYPPRIVAIRRVLATYYTDYDRAIVQYLPDCANYDNELGYILRPGSCRFRNRGFDTRLTINSAGLRDNESALYQPEVIVLGDSHAMGWGVEDDESFPSVLERLCRVKVLNAGISSYGTARQIKLLERLDRTALKWIVVQYSDNDHRENTEFQQRGAVVPMSPSNYKGFQDQVAANSSYFLGKHLTRFLPHFGNRLMTHLRPAERVAVGGAAQQQRSSNDDEVAHFLFAIQSAPALSRSTRAIVFELNGRAKNDGKFAKGLSELVSVSSLQNPWRSMVIVEPSAYLPYEMFLPLDDHMSADGHRRIADLLARVMECREGSSTD